MGTGCQHPYGKRVIAVGALARTYQAMGLLPEDRPASWYDPGSFWSGDDLALRLGRTLGPELAVPGA